ncbi:type IV secretory system conjugative DNA transfer family protein [Actinomadura sp. DC4]|uniref:type IV secretory system conjugative DNA transfer family protein n=1 Tax=Actinomadura sp. DC4 TaxID=3055069 RepID=UPI0025B243C5|nr:type IV secretory system conjugative DNA transfer family protein [Actinomadura sp. DC4]MDN3359281.1 type IV secretory system conjugative DNA transfer family protein [Actinomadura sp. DC4]
MRSIDPRPFPPVERFLDDPMTSMRHGWDHLTGLITAYFLPVFCVALTATVATVLARSGLLRWRHARLNAHARVVEIMPPPSVDMAGAEALWTHLLGLLRPRWLRPVTGVPHVAWEYEFTAAGMLIRLWVPGVVPPGLVERAVEGAWPGARIVRATDRIAGNQLDAGGRLRLARPDHYPLRSDFETDPLRGLLAAADALTDAETVVVQVLVRPVTGRRLRRAGRYATGLRTPGAATSAKAGLFDMLPIGASHTARPTASRPAEVPAEVRAILAKAARPRLETVVQYAVSTDDTSEHGQAWLRGRAHAIASSYATYTGFNHLRRQKLRHGAEILRARRMGHGDLLSVPELAAICHIPTDETVPGLNRAGARPTPPPPALPSGGPGVRVLGRTEAGPPRTIGIRIADARHHTHMIGETGTGKTTGLLSMQLDDAMAGRGLVSIEPKGDSTLILSRLPESLIGKVALIDPDDHAPPPCLNILDGGTSELTADVVVGIFRRIYADSWGPRTDDILRSAILTAATNPDATLADVPRLLDNDTYRAKAMAGVRNPFLADFWSWYDRLSAAQRANVTGPVMNKLRAVLLRGFARDVLAAGRSSVDIGELLDTGGLLVARLPKGVLGEDTARLLGSLILAKTWQAIQARARRPDAERPDCAVYIDECQNFLTLPHGLDDMLAEARSYRAGLILAHQNLTQLPQELRESLAANARNKIVFTISPNDARHIERHMAPQLSAHDLANLSAFQAAARLLDNGALTSAFTLRTRPLPPPVRGREKAIREASRARYVRRRPDNIVSGPLPGDPR